MDNEVLVQDKVRDIFIKWRLDPLAFVYEGIGFAERQKEFTSDSITKQQREFLQLVGKMMEARRKGISRNENPTAVELDLARKLGISLRAGQGPGKTTVMAWTLIWFLCCFRNSIAPCIAPKAEQLKTTLWKEVGIWLSVMKQYGSPLVRDKLIIQSDKIYHKDFEEDKHTWAAILKTAVETPDKAKQGAKARGDHSVYMINFMEEASGIPDGVFDVLEGTIQSDLLNFNIMIFNPIKNKGYAYETHHSRAKDWVTLHWSNEDCERIPKEAVKRVEDTHGRDSNFFRVNVLGEFPTDEADAFIPLYLIEEALDRDPLESRYSRLILGVDPATFGKDRTAICERRGDCFGPFRTFKNQDEMKTAHWLERFNQEYKPSMIVIDANGIGSGVATIALDRGLPIYRLASHNKARNEVRFNRIRDELLWSLRPLFFEGRVSFNFSGIGVSPEMSAKLKQDFKEELTTLRYKDAGHNVIQFEPKDNIRKRLGRSPDLLDAFWMTMYFEDPILEEYNKYLDDYGEEDDKDSGESWMSI